MDIIVWPETMMIYVGTRQQIVDRRGRDGGGYMIRRIWCDDTVCGKSGCYRWRHWRLMRNMLERRMRDKEVNLEGPS
jgi:hypothetical protein